jgi:16S rRNA (adenine1518-N6/adenine1519-N6)-dimethyltransferase
MPGKLSPLQARTLLKRYGVKPRKALGQNFLISEGARDAIIEAADLDPSDAVLEIGPGLGALTEALAGIAARVVSIELDEGLFQILEDTLGGLENVILLQGDILNITPGELGLASGYLVVANIPYNITSALIRHLMESEITASRVVLTVQKEVAERIVAAPGDMNLLALSVQVFGVPSIQTTLSPETFYPAPSVESAVVRIDMYPRYDLELSLLDTLFKLAKAGFSQKRKQLKNAIAHGMPIDKSKAEKLLSSCGIEPSRRAQTLDIDSWYRLAQEYEKFQRA